MVNNKNLERRPRIIALDLIRGAFMIAIIINHLAWSPSLYSLITGQSSLLASAAEGFFAISGVLVGYIYGPRILRATKTVFKKLWKRALSLYLLSVFFTILYTAWAILTPDTPKFEMIYDQGTLKYTYNTLTMRYAFGWADFLNRYAVFMLAAPLALWLIAKGRSWIVVIASISVWALLRKTELLLPFSAWQIVFFLGIVIGYYLPLIEKTVAGWSRKVQQVTFTSLTSAFIITYAFSIAMVIAIPLLLAKFDGLAETNTFTSLQSLYLSINQYFDKPTLDPARILVGALWFAGLYVLFRRYETKINTFTYGVLEILGKNSLFVYCLHAFVLFIIDLYFLPPSIGERSLIANTIVATAVLILIYLITKHRAIFTHARYALLPSTKPK